MVIVCNKDFDQKEEDWNIITNNKFNLSEFQKWAIWGIIHGNHVLITAHTGSGKTLPAEFAIDYFTSKGKKVIYTSPIKALSNQKFHEFKEKFPSLSKNLKYKSMALSNFEYDVTKVSLSKDATLG